MRGGNQGSKNSEGEPKILYTGVVENLNLVIL